MELDLQIEGVLFYKASPQKIKALATLFSVTEEEVQTAANKLSERLQSGATRLTITDSELELVTAPELDSLIESMRRDELKRDIGKAGAETLAIVLYKGPITRVEIDRIRGVNSSFILRNLMIRGLVTRNQTTRGNTFAVSPELLNHLGISQKSELTDYASVLDKLEKFEKQVNEETTTL